MDTTNFQEKIAAARPVVVDFWAPWCAPCRVTKPVLEKLAKEYEGRVDFLPVNADESPEVLAKYRVAGIPTVIAFKAGEVVGRVIGARGEAGYRSMFEALATGQQVKVSMTTFDRILRLGGGTLLTVVGVTTGNWLVTGLGVVIAFLGVYDRCPVWAAFTRLFKRK